MQMIDNIPSSNFIGLKKKIKRYINYSSMIISGLFNKQSYRKG